MVVVQGAGRGARAWGVRPCTFLGIVEPGSRGVDRPLMYHTHNY